MSILSKISILIAVLLLTGCSHLNNHKPQNQSRHIPSALPFEYPQATATNTVPSSTQPAARTSQPARASAPQTQPQPIQTQQYTQAQQPTYHQQPSPAQVISPKQFSPTYSASSKQRQHVVSIAQQLIGAPYRYGGTTPSGFDCSGFTQFVFKQANITIPRTAAQQRDSTQTISSLRQLIPGDLIFFKTSERSNHVGIYVGNNQFVHTSTGQKQVKKSNLQNNYWRRHFVKFGRFIAGSQHYATNY